MSLPPPPEVLGFLPDDEGEYLHKLALQAARVGPILEIGSWCGRSTLWLADAAKQADSVVFALDHHRGSEEHQPGEMFHDTALTDESGRVDTLGAFRRNMAKAGCEDWVIPVVASSALAGRFLEGNYGLVFIDGGHSLPAALTDWRQFGHRVRPGGILAVHDVFPNSAQGGQAPFTLWRMAVESGLYQPLGTRGSLRALRRMV